MKYPLRDCATGKFDEEIKTSFSVSEKDGILTFVFEAENSGGYCPFKHYNDIHSKGDACELLIGSDPERRVYYEIEVSAQNVLMICKMQYNGETADEILLDMDFVKKPFVNSDVIWKNNGYVATLEFPIENILTGDGAIFFNAYRIETKNGTRMDDEKLLYALNPTMRRKFHTPSRYVWLKEYLGGCK
jgi:hypothetical protein